MMDFGRGGKGDWGKRALIGAVWGGLFSSWRRTMMELLKFEYNLEELHISTWLPSLLSWKPPPDHHYPPYPSPSTHRYDVSSRLSTWLELLDGFLLRNRIHPNPTDYALITTTLFLHFVFASVSTHLWWK